MNISTWLDDEVLGSSLFAWGTSVGVFIGVVLLLVTLRRVIRGRLRALGRSVETGSVDGLEYVVDQTRTWFLVLAALFVASRIPQLPVQVETILNRVIVIGVLLQLGIWVVAVLTRIIEAKRRRELEEDPGAVATIDMLGFIMRMAVWTVVLLLVLDNLGVNITALVAGLGVGGIAVALAAQNILGDLFASLSIVLGGWTSRSRSVISSSSTTISVVWKRSA